MFVKYSIEINFPRTKEILFSNSKSGQPTILLKYYVPIVPTKHHYTKTFYISEQVTQL